MSEFQYHIFVCVNERPPGHPRGCCLERGGEEIRQVFKREIDRRGLGDSVRANKAGCMDHCENGACVVVYPQGIWYGGVSADDVVEILDALLDGGRAVERLRIEAPPA